MGREARDEFFQDFVGSGLQNSNFALGSLAHFERSICSTSLLVWLHAQSITPLRKDSPPNVESQATWAIRIA